MTEVKRMTAQHIPIHPLPFEVSFIVTEELWDDVGCLNVN